MSLNAFGGGPGVYRVQDSDSRRKPGLRGGLYFEEYQNISISWLGWLVGKGRG